MSAIPVIGSGQCDYDATRAMLYTSLERSGLDAFPDRLRVQGRHETRLFYCVRATAADGFYVTAGSKLPALCLHMWLTEQMKRHELEKQRGDR